MTEPDQTPPYGPSQPPSYPSSYPSYPPPGHPPYGPPPGYPPHGWAPAPPPRRSRTPLVLALLAAIVLVAAAVIVPLAVWGGDEDAGREERAEETSQGTSLDEVVEYDDLPTTHVPDAVDYEQTPPVGGPHFDEWLECGVYESPVQDENAVHDLEHGTVWITYDPALSDEDVALLEEALPQNGILSPYDGLPAPVVATVWGAQLALEGADDPGLAAFIEAYDDGVTAPEPFASCAGGTATNGDPA